MNFYKVSNGQYEFWALEGYKPNYGEVWYNMRGGWQPKAGTTILAQEQVKNKDEFIDRHRKEIFDYLIEKDSDFGWLAPNGEFYGCAWANHERLAEDYFGEEEGQLERKGWIRVFRSFELGIPVYCQSKVSPQQRIWLEDHDVEYHYC